MSVKHYFEVAKKYVSDRDYRFQINNSLGLYRTMPDEEFLRRMFRVKVGKELNLDNPQTFSEKMQWLKLYNRNPIYTTMVDKYEAKKYVSSIIGGKYIIPTLGIWNNFDDIDFCCLPEQFVLKCTHDSGGTVICKEKKIFDKKRAREKIETSLKRNYYWDNREWPYRNVNPKIIAEEYFENDSNEGLHDYKVWCFDGQAKYIQYITGRISDKTFESFYDCNWRLQDFSYHNPRLRESIPKPKKLEELISIAEILSQNIPFVRVDFYILPDDSIRFGELTFYPVSGLERWHPEKLNLVIGEMIQLPTVKK